MTLVLLTLAITLIAAPPSSSSSSSSSAPTKERLFITNLQADNVDARVAQSIERAIARAAVDAGYDALSTQDIATMLDIEAARQAAGCDDASSCFAELAGGLGAQLIVTGTVVKLGARRYELSLALLENNATTVKNRVTVEADSTAGLRELTPGAASRLFGVSSGGDNTAAVIWIGAGTVAVVGGAVGVIFGALQRTNADAAAVDVTDAAAAYEAAPARRTLDALARANASYSDSAESWNTWGLPFVVVGSAVAVGGVVAVVVGVTGLQ